MHRVLYRDISGLKPGLHLQFLAFIPVHPPALGGQPGAGLIPGRWADYAERTAGQPWNLPYPGPNSHRLRPDTVADFPGKSVCVSSYVGLQCFGALLIFVSVTL